MKKKLLVSMFAVGLALPFNMAFAIGSGEVKAQKEENRAAIKEQREENKEAIKDLKEQKLEQRCKNIQTKLETRINRYENSGNMFENVFGNMIARVQRLIDRLKAKNVDVSKLEADLVTLKEKVNKLLADQETFMATLRNAGEITCTEVDRENSTETKAKIGEARKVLQTLREDRLDIRNFFKSTIKPDILAIRKQLAQQKSTTAETTQTTETEL